MKKLISMLLITMILCSLLTVPALAEDAQGQAGANAEELTATMSVVGGTINPDGTVTWAEGENILTITMSDGSVCTITVIYDPETLSPAVLSTLTVSGVELPMESGAVAVATPNATDTIAVVTEPADAVVTINGTVVENGEIAFNWAEGSNELAIEVSKEGFETTAYTMTVEYTPVVEVAPEETAAPEETSTPVETTAPAETAEPEVSAVPETETAPVAEETGALAGLTLDNKEIDLDKFVKVASDEKQSSFSFNAATDAAYDLTASTGTVVVTAAEGWTVSSVKLNGAAQTAAAADTYSLRWAKANDLEITLKQNGSDVKAVYSLILNNTLPEAAVDTLAVNGADVTFLTAVPAAADNSYSLQVSAAGKTVSVSVNGIPVAPDANGMILVPAVAGVADSVVVTVSQEGALDKTYAFTVNAVAPVVPAADQTVPAVDTPSVTEATDNAAAPEFPV